MAGHDMSLSSGLVLQGRGTKSQYTRARCSLLSENLAEPSEKHLVSRLPVLMDRDEKQSNTLFALRPRLPDASFPQIWMRIDNRMAFQLLLLLYGQLLLLNPLFDVDRWRRGSFSGVTGSGEERSGSAFSFSTIIFEATPKIEKVGKPSAFYTYGVLRVVSVRGTVIRLPSPVIRRF